MAFDIEDEQPGPWEPEAIPNEDRLYYRVSLGWLRPGNRLHPGVFRELRGAMSVDWCKYSTAEATRGRTGRPDRFGVVALHVSDVRAIRQLIVEHDPVFQPDNVPPNINRSHSGIMGIQVPAGMNELGYTERVQLALEAATGKSWVIPPGGP